MQCERNLPCEVGAWPGAKVRVSTAPPSTKLDYDQLLVDRYPQFSDDREFALKIEQEEAKQRVVKEGYADEDGIFSCELPAEYEAYLMHVTATHKGLMQHTIPAHVELGIGLFRTVEQSWDPGLIQNPIPQDRIAKTYREILDEVQKRRPRFAVRLLYQRAKYWRKVIVVLNFVLIGLSLSTLSNFNLSSDLSDFFVVLIAGTAIGFLFIEKANRMICDPGSA